MRRWKRPCVTASPLSDSRVFPWTTTKCRTPPRSVVFAKAWWLRKGNRTYYGYKIHAATDSRDGFVRGGHATPANRSDTEEFVSVLDEVGARAGESVYADKGYSSQLNRYVLAVRGLTDGIMHKAARNRELTRAERAPTAWSAAFGQRWSASSAPSSAATDFAARAISECPRSSWNFSSTPWPSI